MSSGHSSSARTSSHGHSSVNWLVVWRSWTQASAGVATSRPPVAARIAASSASFAPRSRYSAAVGATRPERPTERRLAGPLLRDADGVRAAVGFAIGAS